MPPEQFQPLHTAEELQAFNRSESTAETFIRSIGYAGLQSPINGAAQLLDRTAGTNALPSVQLIDAPHDSRSIPAIAGEAVAVLGHTAAMLALGNKLAGSGKGFFDTTVKRAMMTGAIGAVYGGVLTPVNEGSFGEGRMRNMADGFIGMAAMSAFNSVYRDHFAKDVKFSEAPMYHGVLMPGSFLGLGTMSDSFTNGTTFLSQDKLQPIQTINRRFR